MPELPEVETTVKDLKKKVRGRTFVDVWTDFEQRIKKPKSFKQFRKEILNKKIKDVNRKAKLILFELSEGKTLLIHQKLTGHLLLGKWRKEKGKWIAKKKPLKDKMNSYIHLIFTLDNKEMLALSDLRKFAKVELWNTEKLFNSPEITNLGPEPLEKEFSFFKFKERLGRRKGKIKQIIMDPKVIAGIGNIYSDEILFDAGIHPFRLVFSLTDKELNRIYEAIPRILKKAIKLRGESFSDWRDLEGELGDFDRERRAYQREGRKCYRCKGLIVREKIGGRSAHFCPKCQK